MNSYSIKRLIGFLAVSGFLNIILLTLVVYSWVKEQPPTLFCQQKLAAHPPLEPFDESTSRAVLRLRSLSVGQLASKLNDSEPIENGYSERDLALACLVSFYDFDLARSLKVPLKSLQQRLIAYGQRTDGSKAMVTIFPNLRDHHFETIHGFIQNERWPQTPKGLFALIKSQDQIQEGSLMDAFCLTSHFLSVESIFRRQQSNLNRLELVQFLAQGEWQMLDEIYQKQCLYDDTSDTRRQAILLDYIQKGSTAAATLLLKIDGVFAVKKLDDSDVLTLLSLLAEKSEIHEKFAKALLMSPRSDAVWKAAAAKLYEYSGEKMPEPFQYLKAVAKFNPTSNIFQTKEAEKKIEILTKKEEPIKRPQQIVNAKETSAKSIMQTQDRLYIVQEGDTLWKLSKRFSISIEVLRRHNRLSSDGLKPGSPLRIPVDL